MKREKIVRRLRQFGLTNEEAAMYHFLLQIKSGTIREIHSSKEYALKQRSNLYKILNSLKEKKLVTEEEKGGKKRFFPIAPHIALNICITEQEQTLNKLKESASKLTPELEKILKVPFEGFSPIPEPLVEFITGIINEDWSIREPPQILKPKGLGTIYSVEFDTYRQFAGHSAGLAIYIFRYKEHRDDSIEEAEEFQRQQFEQALKQYSGPGFFQIEDYWTEEKVLENTEISIPIPYLAFHVKSNISPDSQSGMTNLLFQAHPTKIIAIWAADMEDFIDLVKRVTSKFTIIERGLIRQKVVGS